MTAVTDDLITFIRARIEEDQAVAEDAARVGGMQWTQGVEPVGWDDDTATAKLHLAGSVSDENGDFVVYDEGRPRWTEARHIARHDPARVLRGIEAKRRILDEHQPTPTGTGIPGDFHCSTCVSPGNIANEYPDDWNPQRHPCTTVRLLGAEHADHPDYRQEWTP